MTAVSKDRPTEFASSQHGMVSTASSIASEAGAKMLELGGNAVDAAVAAAFCLGVTEPQASGLGGQSMAVLYIAESNEVIAIDGSSRAPFVVDPMNIPSEPRKLGLKASTVPSTPATLGYLLDRYGHLKLSQVLQPALEAAKNGFKVTALIHRMITKERDQLSKDPLASKRFLKDDKALAAGSTLIQPELGKCLERLVEQGWQEFYQGRIGDDIVRDMKKREGLITPVDLSQIPTPRERPVLEGHYRDIRLATFPPPGAGRALIQILNILEAFEPEEIAHRGAESFVTLAMIFMHALRDRDQRPVDPNLYLQSRKKRMVDKKYAVDIAERIRKLKPFLHKKEPGIPHGTGETTHLCAADREGNVVGITQSIELVFGGKRMNPTNGFFYNNYMSTFNYQDMTHPYFLLPGASPWSSVAPTILFRKRKPVLTLGSPGSERISTSLAQVITRVVDQRQGLCEAIAAPRLHSSKAGHVQIESKRFGPEVLKALDAAGFRVVKRGNYSFYLGCVQAILLPTRNSGFLGVADPRRDGSACGPKISDIPSGVLE